jgi:predicted CoA-binding protein
MESKKKTVVIGASPNPARYSHLAIESLRGKGYETRAIGLRQGRVMDVDIETDQPEISDVDTVTLYVGPRHQEYWKSYIHSLKPRRVIFNPGTENAEFETELETAGIETERACTLVLLGSGVY